MKDNCPTCFGISWVCERHPNRPYGHEAGCACGYAAPCECNDSNRPDTSRVIIIVEAVLR